MEIGSEFWLECGKSESMVQKHLHLFGQFENYILTSSGRSAIQLLLQTIKPVSKTVLLPAYICESVIAVFQSFDYQCRFYDLRLDLSPNMENMEFQEPTGVFFHMGYFGFHTDSGLQDMIKKWKSSGTIVIEDVTHTLFSTYNRYCENDYSIASIRKWLGLPSGGLLASCHHILPTQLLGESSFAQLREEALTIKKEYMMQGDMNLKQRYLQLFEKAEELLEKQKKPDGIDVRSMHILRCLNQQKLILARRQNYGFLWKETENVKGLAAVLKEAEDGVCPLFFPVYIREGRECIRRSLQESEIYCPVHWKIPEMVNLKKMRTTADIYEHILSIPCDQRYGISDMKRIVEKLKECLDVL